MTPDLTYFKDVTAISRIQVSSYLTPDVNLINCSTIQSMELYKVEKIPASQIINADSLNDALLVLNPKYMEEMHGQTMKLDPEITTLPRKPLNSIEYKNILRENIKESEVAELETVMNLTHLFKKLDYNDLTELFNITLHQHPDQKALFLDALLSTKTSESDKFILTQLINPESTDMIDLLDRVNLALNLQGSHFDPAFVMALLESVIQLMSFETNSNPLKDQLIPTLGGLLYKLCKNHYLCRHKDAQNAMKMYYDFITTSLTGATNEGYRGEEDYENLVPLITSLSNLPTFYSAKILTGLLQEISMQNSIAPKDQDETLGLVLTQITEGLSRFACQNFRDISHYSLPKFSVEIRGHTEPETYSNTILSVLNHILLDTLFNFALARDNLASILLRCDYSQLFLSELTDNLIERYKSGRDHQDYMYQYARISQLLSHSSFQQFHHTYQEWKHIHNLMLKMFPYFMFAQSQGSYTPIQRHQIGQFVFIESKLYRNSKGGVENLDINMRLKDSQPFQVKFRAQTLVPHTLQSGDSSNPTTSKQTPQITAQFSVGQNTLLPIPVSSSDLESTSQKTNLKSLDFFKGTLSIQDYVGAFCLPNGFPVHFIYTGALQSEIEPSLQSNSPDKSYQLLLDLKLNYMTQSSFSIVGDVYQSNLTQTSQITSTLTIKGDSAEQGYNFKESQLCTKSLRSNYTRLEISNLDKIETVSPVFTAPLKCEWLF